MSITLNTSIIFLKFIAQAFLEFEIYCENNGAWVSCVSWPLQSDMMCKVVLLGLLASPV